MKSNSSKQEVEKGREEETKGWTETENGKKIWGKKGKEDRRRNYKRKEENR